MAALPPPIGQLGQPRFRKTAPVHKLENKGTGEVWYYEPEDAPPAVNFRLRYLTLKEEEQLEKASCHCSQPWQRYIEVGGSNVPDEHRIYAYWLSENYTLFPTLNLYTKCSDHREFIEALKALKIHERMMHDFHDLLGDQVRKISGTQAAFGQAALGQAALSPAALGQALPMGQALGECNAELLNLQRQTVEWGRELRMLFNYVERRNMEHWCAMRSENRRKLQEFLNDREYTIPFPSFSS